MNIPFTSKCKYVALAVATVATGGAAVLISATEEEEREHHGGWHFVKSQQNSKISP